MFAMEGKQERSDVAARAEENEVGAQYLWLTEFLKFLSSSSSGLCPAVSTKHVV